MIRRWKNTRAQSVSQANLSRSKITRMKNQAQETWMILNSRAVWAQGISLESLQAWLTCQMLPIYRSMMEEATSIHTSRTKFQWSSLTAKIIPQMIRMTSLLSLYLTLTVNYNKTNLRKLSKPNRCEVARCQSHLAIFKTWLWRILATGAAATCIAKLNKCKRNEEAIQWSSTTYKTTRPWCMQCLVHETNALPIKMLNT